MLLNYMRQLAQHHLAESLLKAARVQDLLYFLGHRDDCSEPLEMPQGRIRAWQGQHPALYTFSGPGHSQHPHLLLHQLSS